MYNKKGFNDNNKKCSDLSGSERGGTDGLVEGLDLSGGAGNERGSRVSNGLTASLAELLRSSHRDAATVIVHDQLQAGCCTLTPFVADTQCSSSYT